MDYNAALEETLQSFSKLVNEQDDPTTRSYVKDKSFYDGMVNTPIENTKLAAYRDNIANIDLLRMANSKLPGVRDALMPIVHGLMKQSSDAAEQDANIRNEMARRKTVSEVLQGMQDIRNPVEAASALKILESIGGPKYNPAEIAANYGTKESYDAKKMQGLLSLVNVFSGLRGQDMQMAMQRMALAMRGGSGGSSGNINFKDSYGAWSKYNKILSEIEEASRHPFYQSNPGHFKDLVGRYLNEVVTLAPQDTIDGARMIADFRQRVTELIPEKEPRASKETYVPDDNPKIEELLRQIKEQNGIDY